METILVPLLAAVAGSYLTYYFTLKRSREEAVLRFKENAYGALLLKVQAFLGESGNAEMQRGFLEEVYRSWIYSSDGVILALNEVLDLLNSPGETRPRDRFGHEALGNLVVAMRKDLLGKTALSYGSFRYFRIQGGDY